MFGSPLYWRETHRQPRFLFMDGRLVIILFMAIMHIRAWTVALAIISVLIFWMFERRGISADNIIRYLRAQIVGRKRTARGPSAERQPRDFGIETAGSISRFEKVMEARAQAERKMNVKSDKTKRKRS